MARQHSGDGTIRDPGVGPDLGAFHVEHHDNEREDIMTEQTEQSDMRDRKLETIQNLIAKAEATTFEHEADAFMAKAQELMTRYQIDAFMLATSTGRASTDVPETRIVKVFGPYAAVRTNLLNIIACANEVRVVQNHADDKAEDQEERKQGNFYRICWLTGFPTDIENVMMLFASLNLQMGFGRALGQGLHAWLCKRRQRPLDRSQGPRPRRGQGRWSGFLAGPA